MRRFLGGNRVARALTFGLQNRLQMALLKGHKSPKTLRRLAAASKAAHSLLSTDEAFTLHEIAQGQTTLPGDFAEFGVYRGASAALICGVKGSKHLHLFDTFEGLPEGTEEGERNVFQEGQFTGTLPDVQQILRHFGGVSFHKGFFPDTTAGLEEHKFSFVHLDVDLHDATRDALAFFYPRMVSGGVILTHDYSIIPGVSKAFQDFFALKPENIIELTTTQAMVIIHPR
ncbi:macrocin-O-methyltransferase [Neokomagataea thailandica NBRC 106555]|nr:MULTISPECIES: TylF/MycF/NovP-related O-methyltransferase [Neokomagataea]GBR51980.1 macrocin-O-methyltransferase [Neokomagataea thailandica NBRC 106555]